MHTAADAILTLAAARTGLVFAIGHWWAPGSVVFWFDWLLRIALCIRVVMRRLPVQVALAWLVVIMFAPVIGIFAYILVGENRLGSRRLRRYEALAAGIDKEALGLWVHRSEAWTGMDDRFNQVARLGTAVGGMPTLRGNSLVLIGDSEEFLQRLIEDIDGAHSHCHLLFYIWQPSGLAVQVVEALLRASRRGVVCRVLVDAVGSKLFLRSDLPARLEAGGVRVVPALPASPLRMLFYRLDLRNHRKIAVIDGRIAYTGSQNLSDSTFRSTPRVRTGPWVDAMIRVEGPAAQALAAVFLLDWQLDSGEDLSDLRPFLPNLGPPAHNESIVQVIASGPGPTPDSIRQALLTMIYSCREELIMTTPYFVPDASMMAALRAAAMRGVRVTIVLPQTIDARLVAAASRSHFLDLLESGVRLVQFRDGLLHAKTITVDRRIGLIGSANLDIRSFFLNFEITMLIYDDEVASMLRFMQMGYIDRGDEIDLEHWRRRPWYNVAIDNTAQLLGPLL